MALKSVARGRNRLLRHEGSIKNIKHIHRQNTNVAYRKA